MLFASFFLHPRHSWHIAAKKCVWTCVCVCAWGYLGYDPFIKDVSLYDSPKSLNPKWWSCQKINQPPAFFIDRVIGLPIRLNCSITPVTRRHRKRQIREVSWFSSLSCKSLLPLPKLSHLVHSLQKVADSNQQCSRNFGSGLIQEPGWLSGIFFAPFFKRKPLPERKSKFNNKDLHQTLWWFILPKNHFSIIISSFVRNKA